MHSPLAKSMWNRPWNYKEGIAIGVGLVATGLMLQLSVGLIDWGLTAWPVNGWLSAFFVLGIVVMHCLRRRVYLFQWLSSQASAVSALVFAVAVTIVLGLIIQAPASNTGASWIHRLLSSWPFVLVYVWLTVSLGMTILRVFADSIRRNNNYQLSINKTLAVFPKPCWPFHRPCSGDARQCRYAATKYECR